MRLQQILEKYLPLISNMLGAAALFGAALLTYLVKGDLSFDASTFYHKLFYGAFLLNIGLLLNFNKARTLFLSLILGVAYVAVNNLKFRFGNDFAQTIWFQNLSLFVPINFLFFYLFPAQKFISRKSFVYLALMMAEYGVGEFLGRMGMTLEIKRNELFVISNILFGAVGLVSLVKAVKTGSLFDYAVLFCLISLKTGFVFSDKAAGLSLFFFCAQGILTAETVSALVYDYFYDESGVLSKQSYRRQSKKFPLKYALAIINIDTYDKLAKTLGKTAQKTLAKMIADIIQDKATEAQIYRYSAEFFIILYKSFDRKEAQKELDEIRRAVAGVFFEYEKGKNPVKLTISCCVAEKKRSDSDVESVFARAETELQRVLKFSHNVTSVA